MPANDSANYNGQMTSKRALSPLDRLLTEAQRALAVAANPEPEGRRANPADGARKRRLGKTERAHAAGLMRVNHTGEVAAQALYHGQAALARDPAIKAQLLHAAEEEQDHLAWCASRLQELGSHPSRLGPLWYAGSYAIGAVAAMVSDKVSLGFVAETERQVEQHLGDHLDKLPLKDEKSRAIVSQMQADEAEHGQQARDAGGVDLPKPVQLGMRGVASVMKTVAYWV